MNQAPQSLTGKIRAYISSHRKYLVGAIFAGASTGAAYAFGANSVWATVVIPLAAVALGVNFTPNETVSAKSTPATPKAEPASIPINPTVIRPPRKD